MAKRTKFRFTRGRNSGNHVNKTLTSRKKVSGEGGERWILVLVLALFLLALVG